MEFYKGLSYKDYAEYAVKTKDLKFIFEGLFNIDRNILVLDPSDVITTLSLLYNSLIILNYKGDDIFMEFIDNTTSEKLKNHLLSFINRNSEDKSITAMGYKEVYSPEFKYVFSNKI